jgi:TonB-dependent SusC/RagA subfamily outer membrane receptor
LQADTELKILSSYKQIKIQIMKYKLTLLLFIGIFFVGTATSQNKKKSKRVILEALVIDTENKPIQNASIFVDGKKSKVTSDENGRFQLKLKRTVKSITVFTLFNGAAELKYEGQEKITFVLIPGNAVQQDPLNDPDKPEDDLIDIGYGKAHKKNLSSSVGEVNKEHLKNASHYSNIYDMIKGEVPGVVVSGESITIRGMSSLNLSNEPLYVVDGSPTSSISDISPNDVKSISVLKGSSAAIYGSRGANGVVVIRLKTANDR